MAHHRYSKKQAKKKFIQAQMAHYQRVGSQLDENQRKAQAEELFKIKYRRFNFHQFMKRHVRTQKLKFPKVRYCYHVSSGVSKWNWLMSQQEKEQLQYSLVSSVSQDNSARQQSDYMFAPVRYQGDQLAHFLERRQRWRRENPPPPTLDLRGTHKQNQDDIIRPFELEKYNQRVIAYRQRMAQEDYEDSEQVSLQLIPFEKDIRFAQSNSHKLGKTYKKKNNTLPQIMMLQLTQYSHFKPTKWVNQSFVKNKTRVWACYDCWTYIYNPLTHKCFTQLDFTTTQIKPKKGAILIGYTKRNPFGYNIHTDEFLRGSLLVNSLKPPAVISPHSWICTPLIPQKLNIASNLKIIPSYWVRAPYAVMGRKHQYAITTSPFRIYDAHYPQLEQKKVPLLTEHVPKFSPQILDITRPFCFEQPFNSGDIIGSIGGDIINSSIPVPSLRIHNSRWSIFPASSATLLNFCCESTQDPEQANAQIILSVSRIDSKLVAMLKVIKRVQAGQKFMIYKE